MKITFYEVDMPAGEGHAWVLADGNGWFPAVFASLTAAAAAYEAMLGRIDEEAEGQAAAADEPPVIARGRSAHNAYARALGYPNVEFDRLSLNERNAWGSAAAAVIADIS